MKSVTLCVLIALVSTSAFGYALNNAVLYAPMISRTIVDGHIENWSNASSWATFGKWYNLGLTSKTRAKIAWSDTANRLYIGIDTNEPVIDAIEVGGLYGVLGAADANVTPWTTTSVKGTQIQVSGFDGSGISIWNQNGGTSDGVQAAYSVNGQKTYIEISLPIYSNWTNSSSAITLASPEDVYLYINIFGESRLNAADSLVVKNSYVSLTDTSCVAHDTLVRLRPTAFPLNCADVPTFARDSADTNMDCTVNYLEFAQMAQNWLTCNDPGNVACQ
jgi:hypothetical protein